MPVLKLSALGCTALLFCLFFGCAPPQAIGAFAGAAQNALAAGPPLFIDLHDSCVRREAARPSSPILPLFVPQGSKNAPPQDPPALGVCARFATESEGLTKVSDVVIAYFKATQQLSAFDASTMVTTNETSAQSAAAVAGLSLVQVDSVAKLASLVTRVFTEHYQTSRLVEYLRSADPEIENIADGLDAVIKNYIILLQEEQQTLTARYQSVADTNDKAIVLLLNRAYSGDLVELRHRRAAADAYRDVLKDIRDGHHELVQNVHRLKDKELRMALQPYTSKLEALAPVLQKNELSY